MPDRLAQIRETLDAHDQAHVLAFYDELDPAQREGLLDQIDSIDFDALDEHIERFVVKREKPSMPGDLDPAPYYPHGEHPEYRAAGFDLLRDGKVAAFCVAGGQGTRLGWSGPKGTFPAGVVTGKPLFRMLIEQLIAVRNRCSVAIPLYIMTSPLNDAATRGFMRDNNFFGLRHSDVFMFPQGLLPSIDARTGKLLLADKGTIAMNPDGHGGSIRALAASGAAEDMQARGIEHISYFQVDNPLVRVLDPVFLGLHAAAPDSSAEFSSKMVLKHDPAEKVGVFCLGGGRIRVIEYTQLPEDLAQQRDDDGRLRFGAASIAVHAISVGFVESLTTGGRFALPVRPAHKKVPYVDPGSGRRVEPESPNGVKLETFVFDAIPLAESSIVYEALRAEEFAPIKNATGPDSAATSHRLQSDRAAAWLEANGVSVPRDGDGHVEAKIELSPLTALEPGDLKRARLPAEIRPGESIAL